MIRRARIPALTALLVTAVLPGIVAAHGFGNRYDVALPPVFFIVGGAGVVVVSFVLISLFAGTDSDRFGYRARPLSETPLRAFGHPILVRSARVLSVGLLGLGLLSGLYGPQIPVRNLLPNLVWVGWWIGYTFSVILIGNTWPVLNPWKVVYEWIKAVVGDPSLDRAYPLGTLPMLVLFLGFAWLEIIAPVSESPRWLVLIILAYSAYLWGGMLVFGKAVWLREADPFTRLYHYLGKFAPVSLEDGGEVRMYGVGLVGDQDSLYRPGILAFLVAVLYTVTFDGFVSSPEWGELARAVSPLLVPRLTSTLLMLAGLGLFIGVYLAVARLIRAAAGSDLGTRTLARRFVLSLLPIAIAYQISHFYTFLLTQGQVLLLTLVDPFGLGWTVPVVAGLRPSTELPLLTVTLVWQSQVAIIVLGHVVAVWVAHWIALDVFSDRWTAIRSQVPMMGLMVVYTMLSLWILTRPTVPVTFP